MSSPVMKKPLLTSLALVTIATLIAITLASTTTNRPQVADTTVNTTQATSRASYKVYPHEHNKASIARSPTSWEAIPEPAVEPSPSGRIRRSNLTIEEWVRTQSDPDVHALALSVALLPDLRSELHSTGRYNILEGWVVNELPPMSSSQIWDLVMAFFRHYPQICDALLASSNYAKLPSCVQRSMRQWQEALTKRGASGSPTWKCRVSPFAANCTAAVALLGTGLDDSKVATWQERMGRFSVYINEVKPIQPTRLPGPIEGMCYQYVLCLKANANSDVDLRKCIDGITQHRGLLLKKK